MSSVKLCATKSVYKRSGVEVPVVIPAHMRLRQGDSNQA